MKGTTKIVLGIFLLWNVLITYKLFVEKEASNRIIDAEHINIIEKDGTKN